MKKTVLITLMVIYYSNSFSQEKATLTKDETVNYLKKKFAEINMHEATELNQKNYYWGNQNTITASGEQISFTYQFSNYLEQNGTRCQRNTYVYETLFPCDYFISKTTYSFNPIHIKSISEEKTDDKNPIGQIYVLLSGKVGIRTKNHFETTKKFETCCLCEGGCYNMQSLPTKTTSVMVLYLPFLKSDNTNFNKIKKALEYLRDLYKAEDDPFGN